VARVNLIVIILNLEPDIEVNFCRRPKLRLHDYVSKREGEEKGAVIMEENVQRNVSIHR